MTSADPIRRLIEIMATLRGDPGCPWDKEQTHRTLMPYLVEEAYEVVETIEAEDLDKMCEELGDLLLQIVFHAQLAAEFGKFTMDDVAQGIVDKMVRRHPHVFGSNAAHVKTADDVKLQWEQIKLQEKGQKKQRKSLMDGIPGHLPALLQAERIQSRASEVGFDWLNVEGAVDKFKEEVDELVEVTRHGPLSDETRRRATEEFGDVLFSLAAVGRHLGLIGEEALRTASRRFIERFQAMEAKAEAEGKSLAQLSRPELAEFWRDAKGDNHA